MSQRSLGGRPKRPDKDVKVSDSKLDAKPQKSDERRSESKVGQDSSNRRSSADRHRASDYQDRKSKKNDIPRKFENDRSGNSRSFRAENGLHGDTVSGDRHVVSQEYMSSEMRKHSDLMKIFSDDSRLSKLIRRLLREEDSLRRLTSVRQLKEYMLAPENARYLSRSSDGVLSVLQDLFTERSSNDLKQELAFCLGIHSKFLTHSLQSFLDWMFKKYDSFHEEEAKISIMSILRKTIQLDETRKYYTEYMTYVMGMLQTALENADSPSLLECVVNVIRYVAQKHPAAFSTHFRDTVDILVGWHIDTTQKDSLTEYTSSALVSFSTFWMNDIQFSVTLLGQFLEDMEAYSEDLALVMSDDACADDDVPPPDECVTKMAALIRVFTTVVRCLGSYFSPDPSTGITLAYMIETTERVVKSVVGALKCIYSENMLTAANVCLRLLVKQLATNIASCHDTLLPFIKQQIVAKETNSYWHDDTFLQLVQKVMELGNQRLPVSFITCVLSPESRLMKLRFSNCSQVTTSLMSVYHSMMWLKGVPLLQEAYRLVLCDIQAAMSVLCPDIDLALDLGGDDEPFKNLHYNVSEAQTVIVFNVCALAEIGNSKSNLIGMYALSPSIFTLFTSHLDISKADLHSKYPVVAFTFLQTIYSHSSRHNHFISSSGLVGSPVLAGGMMRETTSASNLGLILDYLKVLLECPLLADCCSLTLHWLLEVISSLKTSPHVYSKTQFVSLYPLLITLGYSCEVDVVLRSCMCLQSIMTSKVTMPNYVLVSMYDLCIQKLNDQRRDVSPQFLSLLKLIPIDVTCRFDHEAFSNKGRETKSINELWLARRQHMSRPPTGMFHGQDFRSIMAFLLFNNAPKSVCGNQWLLRIFHGCQRHDNKSALVPLVDCSDSLLCFWASWESAQYCVQSKLRTPLGKPQETFTTIENTIKKHAADIKNAEGASTKTGSKEYMGCQLSVHVLLQFMEHLEKLLYNAYEGCAIAMPQPHKAVRTFFRTNKGTCQEWLTRIRMCIIIIASHAGQSVYVVRQGSDLLREMKESGNTGIPEFEHVIMYVVKAYNDLKCPQAIVGLYAWSKDILGKKLPGLKGAVDKASAKCEQAVIDLKQALHDYVTGDTPVTDEACYISPSTSPNLTSDRKFFLSKSAAPDPVVAGQLSEMITECYLSLGSWEDVLNWQDMLKQYRLEHSGKGLQSAFTNTVDFNYIKALSSFESSNLQEVKDHLELVAGAALNNLDVPSLDGVVWDKHSIKTLCNQQFLRAATLWCLSKDREGVETFLNDTVNVADTLLTIESIDWPPRLPSDTLTQAYCLAGLRKFINGDTGSVIPLTNKLVLDPDGHSVDSVQKVSALLELQRHQLTNAETSSCPSAFLLSAAYHSRKQSNYKLAETFILKHVQNLTSNADKYQQESILTALSSVRASNENVNQLKGLKIERELSKLLYATGEEQNAMEMICSSLVHFTLLDKPTPQSMDVESINSCNILIAKSIITLVKWLQNDQKNLNQLAGQLKWSGQGDESSLTSLAKNMKLLLDLENSPDNQVFATSTMTESDVLIGRLYHMSPQLSPDLAKGWFVYAGWCYKWGRKAVDTACQGSVDLTTDEKSNILACLPKGISDEETEIVLNVMSKVHANVTSDEEISDQMFYDNNAEITRRQLLASSMALQVANESCVDSLLDVWKGIVVRVHHYYHMSAKSYFRYLEMNAQSTVAHEDGNITATLRLLRLLVKHAAELRDVLEYGLAHTPTTPWRGIIPQLFSRLNHPESYVRQSVSELLCRVAQDVPHLIVYPAIVGCSFGKNQDKEAEKQEKLLNEYLTENEDKDESELETPDEEESPDDEETEEDIILKDHFQSIVNTLSQYNPQMIEEIQLLVEELRRVTLLWDELWLGTLSQHHNEVNKRLLQLDNEVKKVMSNTSLNKDEKKAIIREKHKTLLKPTVYVFERLQAITNQPPQTPHEQWFQTTYGKTIEDALNRLKNPSNPSTPLTTWYPFKQFHHSLQQRAQKRSSLVLKMNEISCKLSSLKNTVISMPGVQSPGQVITIESIHNVVQILPTKTKPKKLVFLGSDGKRYSYLFKGLEDLHLDERIMQFLSIVNNMFVSTNRENGLHQARHYSVTPLGSRSGLIQWVDGATPLFGLYKRWQQREVINQALKAQVSGQSNSNATSIPRPSELFYNKLNPLLKDKATQDNRKEWPVSVLKKVLEELMADTPSDLLAKELWCSSTSPSEWFHVVQTYSRSTAVMSMIGYIIGLGDRHLDNVLVDLTSGEVIHIDYNVCFEKGKGLRVPEKVPFRMSQNLECALGVTGVEGTFRTSCEHVLRVMRKGRETLLTLLEAFVYDPLVDWTTGNETGYAGAFFGGEQTAVNNSHMSKKEMEREISWSLFSIRITEMKSMWLKNKDELVASLPTILSRLHVYNKSREELQQATNDMANLDILRDLLADALKDKKHDIYTVQQRYEEHALVKTAKTEVMEEIQHRLEESDNAQKLHELALATIRSPKLQQIAAELTKPLTDHKHGFSDVMQFLQGAGQSQLVDQCEQIEAEMSKLLHHRRSVLGYCRDLMLTFATVVCQLPHEYVEANRNFFCRQWLQELVCDFSTQKVLGIVEQHKKIFGFKDDVSNVSRIQHKLETATVEANNKLMKLIERRNQEVETQVLRERVVDTTTAIQQYVKDNLNMGSLSMIGVVVTALCALNKRYLVMEGAASAAGDRLMDLTSRDGDWFLDELYSMSGNINQLLSLLQDPSVVETSHLALSGEAVHVIQVIHNIYNSLQELHMNFRDIIVPESLKSIQTKEQSLLEILEQLNGILSDSSKPMTDIITQLEIQLRNAIMGINPSDVEMRTLVMKIRRQFEELLQCDGQRSTEMSPGQMLLMGFNGLFSKVDSDFQEMLAVMDGFHVPDNWRKVDVVWEAKGLQMSAFTDSTLGILSDIFFIKRLVVMQKFFTLCQEVTLTMSGCDSVYEDEHLGRPVKHFIAEFIRKQVIGLPSQSLGYILCMYIEGLGVNVSAEIELKDIGADSRVAIEDLCKKAVELCLKNGTFQHHHLTTASSLTSSHDAVWRKQDLARRLDHSIIHQKSVLQRTQLQLARYEWLMEDDLVQAGHNTKQLAIPNRTAVMSELRKNVHALMSQESTMSASQEKRSALEASIIQRLKWAAGANPTLHQVMHDFEEAQEQRKSLLEIENKLASEVTKTCNGILHFEAMRTRTQEAVAYDTKFVDLFARCERSTTLLEQCKSTVTEVEEMLIDAHPLQSDQRVTQAWLTQGLKVVASKMATHKNSLDHVYSTVGKNKDDVASQVLAVRSLLSTHHKLMSDIRHILKTLSKDDCQEAGYPTSPVAIHEYLTFYKQFSEQVTTMLKLAVSDNMTPVILTETEAVTGMVKSMIPRIYDELIHFAPVLIIQRNDQPGSPHLSFATAVKKISNQPEPSPPRKSSVMKSDPRTGTPPTSQSEGAARHAGPSSRKETKLTRDPRTGKAIQERNSYAVSVWRRVRLKLDGRDPDQNKRLSVPEQVEYVISEATSFDNLAVLYEGWTAWV